MKKKKILLLMFCVISTQFASYCFAYNCEECFEEGYKSGVRYYQTGARLSIPLGCNGEYQKLAWGMGAGYVRGYGTTKTVHYYELLRNYRYFDLDQHNNTANIVETTTKPSVINTQQNQETQEVQPPQYQQQLQPQSQVGNTLIDTGVQVLRSLIGY